jgi:hypothetical protein
MHSDAGMSPKKKEPLKPAKEDVTRITVSIPAPNYAQLVKIAETKRVSLSWVVRDAVDKYVAGDIPLFAHSGKPL